jgi:murein L,D-transpeptidase YafK
MNLSVLSVAAALVLGLALQRASGQSFKAEQMKFDRVRSAIAEKEPAIKRLFAEKRLNYPPKQIFIRVFKREQTVELWVSGADHDTFELLKEYRVCASSGTVGPKREQGDDQVPEGFYRIDRFNPLSTFHLSLGVSYPNQADKILGVKGRLGGDIFIHGNCVTIGCVPITDGGIKELYVIAVEARSAGQTSIPIHIFPAKLNEKGLKRLEREFGDRKLQEFWMSLKPGYDFFEKNRLLPIITIDKQGRYQIKG